MAICMAIQTVMFVAVAIGAFIAWRRASDGVDRGEGRRTKRRSPSCAAHLEHVSATVDEAARALIRGTSAVDDVMTDVRDAMGTVRNSVGTVASVVAGPRTALALGLWKGLQTWRKRRDAQRIEAAATSDL